MVSHKKYPGFPFSVVDVQYLKKKFGIILSIIAVGAMISAAQAKEPFLIESELIIGNRYGRDDLDWNSEYVRDDRTWEFFRSNNSSNNGDVLDTSPGFGYGFGGLDSTHETRWHGLGSDEDLRTTSTDLQTFTHPIETLLNIEYPGTDYPAESDWNLRVDFAQPKGSEQQADSNGVNLSNGLNIFFTSNLALNLDYSYQDWYTGEGRDTVNFEDRSRIRTQLNEVNWESHAIGVGIIFNF
jgi:opacity protein-like surface antigen